MLVEAKNLARASSKSTVTLNTNFGRRSPTTYLGELPELPSRPTKIPAGIARNRRAPPPPPLKRRTLQSCVLELLRFPKSGGTSPSQQFRFLRIHHERPLILIPHPNPAEIVRKQHTGERERSHGVGMVDVGLQCLEGPSQRELPPQLGPLRHPPPPTNSILGASSRAPPLLPVPPK